MFLRDDRVGGWRVILVRKVRREIGNSADHKANTPVLGPRGPEAVTSSRAAERATPTEAMADEYVSTVFGKCIRNGQGQSDTRLLTLSDGTAEIKAIVT